MKLEIKKKWAHKLAHSYALAIKILVRHLKFFICMYTYVRFTLRYLHVNV